MKKVSADEATIFVYDASGVLIAEYSGEVAAEPRLSYLTTDHLGSPRVTTDASGEVISRRDFQPYGEEVFSAERTTNLGYTAADSVRQKFTGYERDIESGLDFAQARYYNSSHGRFTSVDPLTASATIRNPQTFNRYSYGLNSPYKFTDPLGLAPEGYWQTKYSNHGQCTAQAEFCGDDWNIWLDQNLEMFAVGLGDVEKELKHLKKLYGELTGHDLDTVRETLGLAMKILGEKEIADAIIKEFRKDGDTSEPLDGIKGLNLDGGFKIVGEGANRAVAVIANVFDGTNSGIEVLDPYDGKSTMPAAIALALRKTIGAYTLADGKILLGAKAFGGSTMLERVQILIHEAVIHKLFRRKDKEFGSSQVDGSLTIVERLTKILKRSTIFREDKK